MEKEDNSCREMEKRRGHITLLTIVKCETSLKDNRELLKCTSETKKMSQVRHDCGELGSSIGLAGFE
jgi:hypothetical protein